MVDKEKLLKDWKLWLGVLVVILILVIIINYNNLSKLETVEKFLYLVSKSEYEQAKKYITSNFEWDLAGLKERKLERAESFTYIYGDYRLDKNYDVAYVYFKSFGKAEIIKFQVKRTIFGNKINDYEIEIIEY